MDELEKLLKNNPQAQQLVTNIFDCLLSLGIKNMIGCDRESAMSNQTINEQLTELQNIFPSDIPLPELRRLVWFHSLKTLRQGQ